MLLSIALANLSCSLKEHTDEHKGNQLLACQCVYLTKPILVLSIPYKLDLQLKLCINAKFMNGLHFEDFFLNFPPFNFCLLI